MKKKCEDLFVQLDIVISEFLEEVDKKKLSDMATKEWRVKDVLGHITFWHEYYAQQYEALADGRDPFVFRSLAGKNEEGRKKMKRKSKKQMVEELIKANESLRESIVEKKVPKMRYMASREYETGEFLEVVIGHIRRHAVQVRRAKIL